MLSEHKFEYDGLTYRCARKMYTPPFGFEPFGFENDPGPHPYWEVVRSDGFKRVVWLPRGEEFDEKRLEVETLKQFVINGFP